MYELYELKDTIAENGLQLLYVTCFRYEKQWYGTRHTHNFLEIFFCVGVTASSTCGIPCS